MPERQYNSRRPVGAVISSIVIESPGLNRRNLRSTCGIVVPHPAPLILPSACDAGPHRPRAATPCRRSAKNAARPPNLHAPMWADSTAPRMGDARAPSGFRTAAQQWPRPETAAPGNRWIMVFPGNSTTGKPAIRDSSTLPRSGQEHAAAGDGPPPFNERSPTRQATQHPHPNNAREPHESTHAQSCSFRSPRWSERS